MEHYQHFVKGFDSFKHNNLYNPQRFKLFWLRYYTYFACVKLHFQFPKKLNFLQPGLEIKKTLHIAEDLRSKIYFLGPEFCDVTWRRLLHETRLNAFEYFYNYF